MGTPAPVRRLPLGAGPARGAPQRGGRVAEDRLDEDAHTALIDLMARAGRRVDALRQYDTFAQLLHDKLDVAPGPEISALVNAIRSGPYAASYP
jgi:hypothetical protein